MESDQTGWLLYKCVDKTRLRLFSIKFLLAFLVILSPVVYLYSYYFFYLLPDISHYNMRAVFSSHKPLPENASCAPQMHDRYCVPNIVHYIMFGDGLELSFINYLSVVSAYRVQKPAVIMLHCNSLPVGFWWERLWREVPLTLVQKDPPLSIYGQHLQHVYHQSDIAKLQVLRKYGGMYLDFDVIVINPLDPLRQYKTTMGREKPPKLIAGIIISEPNSLFLKLLYESYKNNYLGNEWDYNCAVVAFQLYQKRPDLVHVEPTRLTTPDWTERELLYKNTIAWQELYVLHLMWHMDKPINPDNIENLQGILGEVLRHTYYGDDKKRE